MRKAEANPKQQLSPPSSLPPPPCLPSLPLGVLASAASWLLHTTCPDGASWVPVLRPCSEYACSQIDLVQAFADKGPVSTARLQMPQTGLSYNIPYPKHSLPCFCKSDSGLSMLEARGQGARRQPLCSSLFSCPP